MVKTNYSIAWYARAGHLDLFPLISQELKAKSLDISSSFICNTDLEKDHLRSVYGIKKVCVIGRYLEKNLHSVSISNKNIKSLEADYTALPLIRSLWSTMFEQELSEEMTVRYFVTHLEGWSEFLKNNRVQMLFCEVPSILATCTAWLACQRLGVKFVSFVNIPIGKRILLTSSWEGHYDGLEEKLENIKVDHTSNSYHDAKAYIRKMNDNPEKTRDAISYEKKVQKKGARNLPFNMDKFLKPLRFYKRYQKRKQYYIYPTIGQQIKQYLSFFFNSECYKLGNYFERVEDPSEERFFLFPLHMLGEWSDHIWMGLGYSDQTVVIEQIAACLPIGTKLYVKEHTANFGEKPTSFYKKIKKTPKVRLLHPYEDVFNLVKHAEGIITLGSTVGFEAFLVNKPVVILGEPWYKSLVGIYRAKTHEQLADLLQNIHCLETASEEEKLRVICALYELSFEGVRYPDPDALKIKNIGKFADVFKHRIVNSLKIGGNCIGSVK